MRRLTLGIIAATSLMASDSAFALTATQSVEKEIVVQMPDGTENLSRAPAELVIPGERVVYTLSYTNDDAAPASDLVLTMPVPPEIKYIGNIRTATSEDITHIRWTIAGPVSVGGSGSLSFKGILK